MLSVGTIWVTLLVGAGTFGEFSLLAFNRQWEGCPQASVRPNALPVGVAFGSVHSTCFR